MLGLGPVGAMPLGAGPYRPIELEWDNLGEAISSYNWTGVSFPPSSEKFREINAKIDELCSAIIQSDCDEQLKINAIQRVYAVQNLLKAPDVPWRQVAELLNSPYLAAFFMSLNIIQFIMGLAS